jgi:hypothetical protein
LRHRLAFVWDDLRLIDLRDGRLLFRAPLPVRHGFWPRPVIPSPDGRLVVAAAGPREVDVWSLERGVRLRTMKMGGKPGDAEDERVTLDEISPGGRFLVTEGRQRLWSLDTGREVTLSAPTAPGAQDRVLAFGPSDRWLRLGVGQRGHVYVDPVTGQTIPVLGRLWHPPDNRYHPVEGVYVDHQHRLVQVLEVPSGRVLWQHPEPDGDPRLQIDRRVVRSIRERGAPGALERVLAGLSPGLDLPAGEALLEHRVADPLLLVRTQRRAFAVHPGDRLVPLPANVASAIFQAGSVWRGLAFDVQRSVLSGVEAGGSGLQLWRLPSGRSLGPDSDGANLDRWLSERGVGWAARLSPRSSDRLRLWLRRGHPVLPSLDGRLVAVVEDARWLSLHRARDGARLWRRDLRRQLGDQPRAASTWAKADAWSIDGQWLAATTRQAEDDAGLRSLGALSVFHGRTGRSRRLWTAVIRCGPTFALRGADLVVGADSDEPGGRATTEIRRYDARSGRLRWRHRLLGQCQALSVDQHDRVLVVMERSSLQLALWQVRPDRRLLRLPDGLGSEAEFSPARRYLRTEHLDGTTVLWRVPE